MSEGFASEAALAQQMDPIHAASSRVVLLGLLPAIQVAWADGTVQPAERALILSLAQENGLNEDASAMTRLARWLESRPGDDETTDALRELRGEVGHERVMEWARAVARAEGGVFGRFSISKEERVVLDRMNTILSPAKREPAPAPSLGVLEVLRELMMERLSADTTHRDLVPRDVRTPWPQPSPWGRDRMPPAVLAISDAEHREFKSTIIARYVRSLRDGWWDAVRLATEQSGVVAIDDRELARLVGETPFSRFLVPTLDEVDRVRFARVLERAPKENLYKVDFSQLTKWEPLPGLSVAPTIGLFHAEGDTITPLAISVRERVFEPGDGEAWARARYFFLQGCSISLVVGIHPFLHFPMDSVIAVTREVFDPRTAIARLVEAHSYLHLPLNYGVKWNVRSVAHNHQTEIYTPYPARRDDVFAGISDFYAGVPGNSGFPGFRYPMAAPAFFGPYARFLARYYEVVLAHCRRVALVHRGDARVTRWGEALHELLPGFPSAAALDDPEVLARALAGFVHSVSIWHSTEHHAYAEEPVRLVPQRLRVPEPRGGDDVIPTEQWLRSTDIARQEMARRMFYEAHTLRSILDVDYGFEEAELRTAGKDFADALRACDRAQPRRYVEVERIACSLQF